MIALSVTKQVRRLLAENRWSQRKIAEMTGLSRGTVGAIASGKRPDYDPAPRPGDGLREPAGLPERCPGCGGIVYMPCRLCRVREQISHSAKHRPPQRNVDPEDRLQLNLRGEHRLRYEQVRARRTQH